MTILIDMNQYRRNKLEDIITKQYIAYYGNTTKEVVIVEPKLRLVDTNKPVYTQDDIAQLQGNTDMHSYMQWLSKEEDIDTSTINIIKPDITVPY